MTSGPDHVNCENADGWSKGVCVCSYPAVNNVKRLTDAGNAARI